MSKLYLAGVGPGNPELVTLCAKRIMESADVVAYPVKKAGESSAALNIAKRAANIKNTREIVFSMAAELSEREKTRRAAAGELISLLRAGKTVCMITLGDVSVYSTCGYVRALVEEAGFETETVPGITSFSAAAAAAGDGLCEGRERFAVVPGLRGRDDLERLIDGFDTVIVMKAAPYMDMIYEVLSERELLGSSFAAQDIGMEGGGIFPVEPESGRGYFTTVVIKKHIRSGGRGRNR